MLDTTKRTLSLWLVYYTDQIKCNLIYYYIGEVYDTAYSILKRVSEKLSQIPLPVKIIQLLYTEGVIDKRILNELESKGGYLTDDPLSALLSAIYMDHNMLKTFGTILLRSKKTVPLANVILNEYGKI